MQFEWDEEKEKTISARLATKRETEAYYNAKEY